jgi:hypothetical protein
VEHLRDRITELPQQFDHPQPRPWGSVRWRAIAADQISGISVETFCAILRHH